MSERLVIRFSLRAIVKTLQHTYTKYIHCRDRLTKHVYAFICVPGFHTYLSVSLEKKNVSQIFVFELGQ